MNFWMLFSALLPIVQEVLKSIASAEAAGKDPAVTHQTIVDHVAALPAKIREA